MGKWNSFGLFFGFMLFFVGILTWAISTTYSLVVFSIGFVAVVLISAENPLIIIDL